MKSRLRHSVPSSQTRFGLFPVSIFALTFTLVSIAALPAISHAVTLQSSGTKLSDGSTLGSGTANGLVGYYTMDGKDTNFSTNKEVDESGNGNTATLVNLTTTSATIGNLGQAMTFNGTSSHINATGLTNIAYPAITVSAWVNESASQSGNPRYVANSHTDSGSNNLGFELMWARGNFGACVPQGLDFIIGNGSTCSAAGSAVSVPSNKWFHVVGTYDGSTIKIYYNGALAGSTSFTGTIAASTLPFAMGYGPYGNDYLNGKLDDVRIYSRALSAAEVQQLYNEGK
jgi:hypothetical protein